MAAGLLAMGGAAAVWLSRPGGEPEVAAALPVTVTTLEPVSRYTVERAYAGEVVAGRASGLGFERTGTLISLQVDQGDAVVAGQILARLDPRTLEAQRQQLLAQMAQAQAQLQELLAGPRTEDIAAAEAAVADLEQQVALAQLQRQRREDLHRRGAIAQEELDQQTFGAASLENRLRQARSQLQELQAGTRPEQVAAQTAQVKQIEASLQAVAVDIDKSIIRAPFSGRVSQRLLDEGTVVAAGQPVVELIEAGSLEARIGVPAAVADGLQVGDRQTLQVGTATYAATVAALLPELEASSRTVTVVLTLPATAAPIVGQTARLSVSETEATEGFWLPSTALTPAQEGLWSVYVSQSEEDGTTTVAGRIVEVLHTDAERSLVRGTLQAGDQVITSGTHRIVPDQAITVVD